MKIGICFGCYCPLHQGHLDVIMRSKKECDLTFVVVCGYDNEERTDSCGLPLDKRYRIINNFLQDELVKVIKVNDTELGIDESYSDNNWKIWINAVYDQIRNILWDYDKPIYFNWYVSEPSYAKALEKNCDIPGVPKFVKLMDRNENKISGTMCRTEPLKNWSKITQPFRAYFSHNILIAGTASEGKTTLVKDLAKYFNLPFCYEKGRDICKIKTDKEFNFKDFMYNIYEQHKVSEEQICSPQNPGIFLSDTDNIVTLMYAKVYSQRKCFNLSEDEYRILYEVAKEYAKTTKWNKIFLLAPHEKPIVDDGERYMEDSDYRIRLGFFEILKSLYDEFGYEYEILDGTYYENYLKVRNYIRSLYE